MEIKHLESDFIRSFLSLTTKKPIPEMTLHDISITKLRYHIEYLRNPLIIYVNPQLKYENQKTIDRIQATVSTSYAKSIVSCINKEDFCVRKIRELYLINLTKINNQDYYRELPNFLKGIILNFHPFTDLPTNAELDNMLQSFCNIIGTKKYEEVYQIIQQEAFEQLRLNLANCSKYKLKDYNAELSRVENSINNKFIEITKLNEEKMSIYGKISQLTQGNNTEVNKFIDFLKRCNYVKSIYLENKLIAIHTSSFPISYTFAEDAAEKLILDSANTKHNDNKEILLDALTTRKRYEITHLPVIIRIDTSSLSWEVSLNNLKSNANHFTYPLMARETGSKNRHYFSYTCLGSFQTELLTAVHESNFTKLFATILQYLQTINLADGAGQSWLYQEQIFRDKEFNTYFIYSPSTGKSYPLEEEDLDVLTPKPWDSNSAFSWWRD